MSASRPSRWPVAAGLLAVLAVVLAMLPGSTTAAGEPAPNSAVPAVSIAAANHTGIGVAADLDARSPQTLRVSSHVIVLAMRGLTPGATARGPIYFRYGGAYWCLGMPNPTYTGGITVTKCNDGGHQQWVLTVISPTAVTIALQTSAEDCLGQGVGTPNAGAEPCTSDGPSIELEQLGATVQFHLIYNGNFLTCVFPTGGAVPFTATWRESGAGYVDAWIIPTDFSAPGAPEAA